MKSNQGDSDKRSRRKSLADRVASEDATELDIGLYEGLAGVRLAMRRFLAFSEATLTAAGMTSQQYQALLVIKVAPNSEITMGGLAKQMLLQPNGAVQLVDRLASIGLVERTPSSKDKRSVLVGLTPKGARLLEDLARHHLREMLSHEPLLAESLQRLRRLAKRR
ncbi:MarR family transcriptional regulator [Rhizobium sullae]|uniref:MarR family transcriptional regulator n=1 Tax=Rhizobium sullae TaxID=50338 RepID=A0A2N0D1C6_RHISU|nr:MarR family transcriptional regulator [Rhizobium sullae]PKA39899.1 MarR family transcriptional regulator [Rhizobium sullae]